ncbi:MAG: glycine hydroxymethyltransferase [Chlamydiia bacterium]|nr:glycine hydroxymethyltransferase [Chlamydiia bacterium]
MNLLKSYLDSTPPQERSTAAIAYLASLETIAQSCPEAARAILQELSDQRTYLKLIASENYSSLAVQLAMGNLLTDKYSEGIPGRRFYAGCDNVDTVEDLARTLLCKLFNADHAYVQPHSGADANLVAFMAVMTLRGLNPALGEKKLEELSAAEFEALRQKTLSLKLMGHGLGSGGHLTHGYRHNISSRLFQPFSYEVDPVTHLLDYDKIARQAKEVKPDLLIAGYSSYPRRVNFAKMREIADSVGALFMCDMAHFAGLVAGKVFTGEFDPIPYAHIVTSTTHKTLRGPRGGLVICKGELAETIDKGCPMVLGGPLPHVVAAKAIAFKEALSPDYRTYAAKIVKNAHALAESLKNEGIELLTGGTDNHLMVLNVSKLGITGRQAEQALREGSMTVNRNAIPSDPNGAWYTSGVRIGTPALTTLGMGESEMTELGKILAAHLKGIRPDPSNKAKYTIDPQLVTQTRTRVESLLSAFPLYPEIAHIDAACVNLV